MKLTRAERKQLEDIVTGFKTEEIGALPVLCSLMKKATAADKLKMVEVVLSSLSSILQVYRYMLQGLPYDEVVKLRNLDCVILGLPNVDTSKRKSTKKRSN